MQDLPPRLILIKDGDLNR